MNGTNNSTKHYDMVVIGSCAAGHHGAIQAAKLSKIWKYDAIFEYHLSGK